LKSWEEKLQKRQESGSTSYDLSPSCDDSVSFQTFLLNFSTFYFLYAIYMEMFEFIKQYDIIVQEDRKGTMYSKIVQMRRSSQTKKESEPSTSKTTNGKYIS